MGHLYNTRKGWIRENLARYLLSKIAFLSQPISVADDAGSDFLCTLFQIDKIKGKDQLFPRNSFAIQIKSKQKKNIVNIKNKQHYIKYLEIPFFWGVVDEKEAKLEIYSGEYFESFIADTGGATEKQKLFLELVDKGDEETPYYKKDNSHYLKFPKIVEININSDDSNLTKTTTQLSETCDLMIKNIAAKIKRSYLFEVRGGKNVKVITGPTSVRYCRENFYKELTQMFSNLRYMQTHCEEVKKEFEIYKSFFLQLCKIKDKEGLPNHLIESFKKADTFFSNQNLYIQSSPN